MLTTRPEAELRCSVRRATEQMLAETPVSILAPAGREYYIGPGTGSRGPNPPSPGPSLVQAKQHKQMHKGNTAPRRGTLQALKGPLPGSN